MNREERYERLREVVEELVERNGTMPVVVEGERDVRALRALGLRGSIVTLHRGVSVFNFCERIAGDHGEIVILTDWDVRGGQLARMLREGLTANGVRYDDDLRARISALCRKDIKAVEDLHRYIERLRPRGADGRRRIPPNKAWYADRDR